MNWKKTIFFVTIAALICIIWVKRNIETDERRLEVEKMWNEAYAETLPEPTQGAVILGEQDMWNAQLGETPTKVIVKQEVTRAPEKAEQKTPETVSNEKPVGTAVPDRGEMPTQKPTVVTQKSEPTQKPTRTPQATPGVSAKENVPGVQEGWGKATHPTAQTMSLKRLPRNGEGSVRTDGDMGRTVTVTGDTYLMLYGLYEDETGEVYRHVGVTYLGEEYYGYIPERRITYCEAPPVYSPTPSITPVPTITRVPLPTVVVPKATPTAAPKPTATTVPTKMPIATPRPTQGGDFGKEMVYSGHYDYNIIPDKYNTGCTNTAILTKINDAMTVDGIEYNMGSGGTTVVIDLYYRNKNMPEEVIIRNKDFSDKSFSIWHASRLEPGTKRVIRFENCKFSFASVEFAQDNAKYYFTNCSFVNFKGSDSTFEKCFFGGSYYDGMNPYRNVTVNNSYFGGFIQHNNEGKHSDALQIYGKEGIDATNIFYKNCRIEIPIIKSDQKPQINACLMVQLEYSSANGIKFEDCIINGGGFSIYVIGIKKEITLKNVVFRNIAIGSAHLYGDRHPNYDKNAVFDNIYDTEKLYVGSVWKDARGKVHLSVSNDTAKDRKLVVVTEAGREEYLIECKASAEAAGAKETWDLPIDLDIEVGDGNTDWVVCYDEMETAENQIRFVNWSGVPVYR